MMNELIHFRKNLNKTRKEMAEILGVSKSLYEKIETRERNPSYHFILNFKKTFPTADIERIFFMQTINES